MKRMNLIRTAFFALAVFMGSVSLSAQGNWDSPQVALADIESALGQLNEAPVKQPGQQPGQLIASGNEATAPMKSNCPTCLENIVKVRFLTLVSEQIKAGVAVGTAVSNVHQLMLGNIPQGNPMTAQMQGNVQAALAFATALLSI